MKPERDNNYLKESTNKLKGSLWRAVTTIAEGYQPHYEHDQGTTNIEGSLRTIDVAWAGERGRLYVNIFADNHAILTGGFDKKKEHEVIIDLDSEDLDRDVFDGIYDLVSLGVCSVS